MSRTKIGLAANRPSAGNRKGQRYVAYDTNQEWVSDGTDWIETTSAGGAAGRQLVDYASVAGSGYPSWQNGISGGGGYGDPSVATSPVPGFTVTGENDGTHLAMVSIRIPKFYITNVDAGAAIASVEFGFWDGTTMFTAGVFLQEKSAPTAGNYESLEGEVVVPAWNGSKSFEFKTWGSNHDNNFAHGADYATEEIRPFAMLEWLN